MNISIDFYIDLDRVGQAAIGSWGICTFSFLLLFTTFQLDKAEQRQLLDKDKDKISKGQAFCRHSTTT